MGVANKLLTDVAQRGTRTWQFTHDTTLTLNTVWYTFCRLVAFWQETDFFPKRIEYLQRALDAHSKKDYIASIYVIVPQFEGIVKDYLAESGVTPRSDFSECVIQLENLIMSRRVLMFPREIMEIVLRFLKAGSFWRHTSRIADPRVEVNRHGIAHGVFTGFECEEISLKYLILLDSLWFLLLHDKMLTGSI